MITFSDFVQKYNLKNKATSNEKIQQVFSSLGLNDVDIYLRDGSFQSNIGIVNLHPTKGTHWVCFWKRNYFEAYGCVRPKKLYKFITKQKGHYLYSEYKIQGLTNKKDSYCGSYCLFIIYLTKLFWICIIKEFLEYKRHYEK